MKPVEVNSHGDQPIQQMLERLGASNMPPREHSAALYNCKVQQKTLKITHWDNGGAGATKLQLCCVFSITVHRLPRDKKSCDWSLYKGHVAKHKAKLTLRLNRSHLNCTKCFCQPQGKHCGVSLFFFISECSSAHSSTVLVCLPQRSKKCSD